MMIKIDTIRRDFGRIERDGAGSEAAPLQRTGRSAA